MLLASIIRTIIGRIFRDPDLCPARVAKAANISPRRLHQLFEDSELKPMQVVKLSRLAAGHRMLRDPGQRTKSVKEIALAQGYVRADQFARDFRRQFGVSPRELRP